MIPNPFLDAWHFLTGNTNDYNALGAWKYFLVVLYWGLLVASIAIAARNWRDDPGQRTASDLGTWFMRVLIGTMWFEGMLWKLPLFSESNGLHYWMEQMAQRAAFAWHRDLVSHVYLPYFHLLNPVIFLAVVHALFAIYAAGRSLGLDALLRSRSSSEDSLARLHRALS